MPIYYVAARNCHLEAVDSVSSIRKVHMVVSGYSLVSGAIPIGIGFGTGRKGTAENSQCSCAAWPFMKRRFAESMTTLSEETSHSFFVVAVITA